MRGVVLSRQAEEIASHAVRWRDLLGWGEWLSGYGSEVGQNALVGKGFSSSCSRT